MQQAAVLITIIFANVSFIRAYLCRSIFSMPAIWLQFLQAGFSGFACILLFLAYKLLHKVIALPADAGLTQKRKTVEFYCVVCVIVLLLSLLAAFFKKPEPEWIKASAFGQFSKQDLKQRPLELVTWLGGGKQSDLKSCVITPKPSQIEIPANGGTVMISVPESGEEGK